MLVISVRNVQAALPEALYQLEINGVDRESRNGPVRVFPQPVTTMYHRPDERVLFWPDRDANPFFHFMESLWMLAGRNDVEFPARFAKKIAKYSDDGVTFHGAYGYRWRKHFFTDQLLSVIGELANNHDNRRAVLAMWDANSDLGRIGKDFPCNLGATFQVNHEGALDMVVHNRSNDLIWGAYGANAVHFSMLQEFVARSLGVPLGRYWQVSSNFHAYVEVLDKVKHLSAMRREVYPTLAEVINSPYDTGVVSPYPIMHEGSTPLTWLADLELFMQGVDESDAYKDRFFKQVALPMRQSWIEHKAKNYELAFEHASEIQASDWSLACLQWLERRQAKRQRAQDDGVSYE